MNEVAPQSQGLVESATSKFNFSNFLSNFNVTTALVIEVASYFTAGVLIGFVLKRYFKQVFITLLVFLLMLKGLEYFGVGSMIFNWDRIRALTGIAPEDTLDSLVKFYLAWLQVHLYQVVSAVIGLLVGIKLS